MNSNETTPELIARQEKAVVVAAAGCGKTHLISEAIKYSDNGRQLILTHTHAGVHSIRNKIKKNAIPAKKYRVETIAGFALRYAASYPIICKKPLFNEDETIIYDSLYEAAVNVINCPVGRKIVSLSYSGLYVDEYQDCTIDQHQLILKLSELLPTRILGDPLQGIFDFAGEIVNWKRQVFPVFQRLPDLSKPWRWELNNKNLGVWLSEVRKYIMENESISLENLPFHTYWKPNDRPRQISSLKWSKGKTVGIIDIENRAHKIASSLTGHYNSMEEIERRTLFKFCNEFEKRPRENQVLSILEFASKCMTKLKSEFKTIISCIENNKKWRGKKHQILFDSIENYIRTGEVNFILEILNYIDSIEDKNIFRKELWCDLIKLFKTYSLNMNGGLKKLGRKQIEIESIKGRFLYSKTISRPPLIKGLEFNHAILLDADKLKPKELYVSLTRGSNYLTILSREKVLNPYS